MRRALTRSVAFGLLWLAIAATSAVRAAPPGGESLFWERLAETLKPSEIQKIRALPGIDDAVALLLKTYDGDGDTVTISATRDGVRIEVATASRVCKVRLVGGEAGVHADDPEGLEAPCPLKPDSGGPRTLELDRGIWTVRKPRPPKVKPPTGLEAPAEAPARGTLMRIRIGSEPWQILREFVPDDLVQRHLEWRETIARTTWRDPLLPQSALEAGAALAPLELAVTPEAARSSENLKNPFDDSRMRTADPLPQVFQAAKPSAWDPRGTTYAPPRMTAACEEEVTATATLERAPTLGCFHSASWHARHLFSSLPGPVSAVLGILQVPILSEINMLADIQASKSSAYESAWVASWLAWVQERGSRIPRVLKELTDQERRVLRRLAGRWWSQRISPEFATVLALLIEQHFVGLYPESADIAGFPRRSFFDDPWLWAGNWIAVALATPLSERQERVALAVEGLTPADIGVLVARLEAAPSESPAVQHLARLLAALLE